MLGILQRDDAMGVPSKPQPPTPPSKLKVTGCTQHACHIEWEWEKEMVRWCAYREAGRDTRGNVAEERERRAGHLTDVSQQHGVLTRDHESESFTGRRHSLRRSGTRRLSRRSSSSSVHSSHHSSHHSLHSSSGDDHSHARSGSGRLHLTGPSASAGPGGTSESFAKRLPRGHRVKVGTAGHGDEETPDGGHWEAQCVFLIEGCKCSCL